MMTIKEFWEHVDSIDIESREDGRFTEDEMFEIGVMFKTQLDNGQKREIGGWDYLTSVLKPLDKDGNVMTKGDTFRQWIKDRCYRTGTMEPNVHLLSGKTIETISFGDFTEKTAEIRRDLYKERVKCQDEHNSYRKTLRDEARIETMVGKIAEGIEKLAALPEVKYTPTEEPAVNEAVLLFSDLHVGVAIDNFFNKYNTEIARLRVKKLVHDTAEFCKANHVKRLNFLNLGDCIHGIIHFNGRLESDSDVIEQIMLAAEIIADALNELQGCAEEIIYRSCSDNHSRVVADLKQHIEKENFGKLIDFYLKARLAGTKVVFAEDNLDTDIGMFELLNGKKVVFVHGHRDNYNTIVQDFLGATHQFIDYICLGHYHTSKLKTFQGCKVLINGSVVGSEQYAQSHRLYGEPEQTLLMFTGKNLSVNYINLNIK